MIFGIILCTELFPPERTRKSSARFNGISGKYFRCAFRYADPFLRFVPRYLCLSDLQARGLPIGGHLLVFDFIAASLIWRRSFFWRNLQLEDSIAYVLVGLALAVIGGTIISKSKARKDMLTVCFCESNNGNGSGKADTRPTGSIFRRTSQGNHKKGLEVHLDWCRDRGPHP